MVSVELWNDYQISIQLIKKEIKKLAFIYISVYLSYYWLLYILIDSSLLFSPLISYTNITRLLCLYFLM